MKKLTLFACLLAVTSFMSVSFAEAKTHHGKKVNAHHVTKKHTTKKSEKTTEDNTKSGEDVTKIKQ